jgi:hypothetical protein
VTPAPAHGRRSGRALLLAGVRPREAREARLMTGSTCSSLIWVYDSDKNLLKIRADFRI